VGLVSTEGSNPLFPPKTSKEILSFEVFYFMVRFIQ